MNRKFKKFNEEDDMVTDESETKLNLVAEESKGKLYKTKGFLIPVLSGSTREMGAQYGALMIESMEDAYNKMVGYARKVVGLTDEIAKFWTERAYSTFSNRNKEFYDGLMEGTGWSQVKVGILDQLIEYGIYQAKIHTSFSGCTSIFAWETSSKDGKMYIGRNMDWIEAFSNFPQVLTVYNPDNGSYRLASVSWPGMYAPFTALNEHGIYLDVHDGSSMGGSVVYKGRPPTGGVLNDFLFETSSLEAFVRRLNGINTSVSLILNIADEKRAVSMECSSLAGNRLLIPEGESFVSVNSFLNPDWGIHKRNTVTHSLERLSNMTDRLDENKGNIDTAKTRELMDLPLFEADGTTIGKGCTKPTKVDADQTTHQVVTDVSRREFWLKIPNPHHFADWKRINLKKLWTQ